MTADILFESRLTLSQLAKREGVNPSTVWRWVLKGCRGVKLQSALIGGKRVTSEQAFERFVTQINSEGKENIEARTSRQRALDVVNADQTLTAAGI